MLLVTKLALLSGVMVRRWHPCARRMELSVTLTLVVSSSRLSGGWIDLKFGNVGNYVTSRSGTIDDVHGAQALCASNQALVGFVLDQNSSGTKAGYKYDCINLKGPAKVRTALSAYKSYKENDPTTVLDDIGAIDRPIKD